MKRGKKRGKGAQSPSKSVPEQPIKSKWICDLCPDSSIYDPTLFSLAIDIACWICYFTLYLLAVVPCWGCMHRGHQQQEKMKWTLLVAKHIQYVTRVYFCIKAPCWFQIKYLFSPYLMYVKAHLYNTSCILFVTLVKCKSYCMYCRQNWKLDRKWCKERESTKCFKSQNTFRVNGK